MISLIKLPLVWKQDEAAVVAVGVEADFPVLNVPAAAVDSKRISVPVMTVLHVHLAEIVLKRAVLRHLAAPKKIFVPVVQVAAADIVRMQHRVLLALIVKMALLPHVLQALVVLQVQALVVPVAQAARAVVAVEDLRNPSVVLLVGIKSFKASSRTTTQRLDVVNGRVV